MRNLLAAAICFIAGVLQTASGQNLSNRGKEFWVGYGHHQFFETGANNQEMVLYLSAEQAATVTVSINGTTWTRTYNIPANSVIATEYMPKTLPFDCRLFSLPASFGGNNSEGVFTRGIHIESNVPIVAYAHIFGNSSSGSTMLMPTETWGYNYISVNFTQNYSGGNCYSWLNVIANHDNTKIQITPSVRSRNGRLPAVAFEVVLQRGEIYQLLGDLTAPGANTGYDLTGTTVKSVANDQGQCYPVAAFSGSSRTLMGDASCSPGGGDNVIQQIFPSQAWGKRYLTSPTSTSNVASTFMTNYFRVVVKDPSTVVKRNGITLTGLIANTYYQFTSTTADYITADKPILVSQYMPSSGCYGTGLGDPEMFYISPIEQAIKRIGFYRNNREIINYNYLTLIIPTPGVFSLLIDGSSTFDYSYPHPNLPGYTVVIKRWTAAQAQCIVSSDSAFTAITYGLGSVESYGYNAGTLINNLSVIGDIRNTYNDLTPSNPFTCKKTPFVPSVLIAYPPTKMVWRFSQLGSLITPNADITNLAPVPTSTQVINGVTYYRYTLTQPFVFNDTGVFNIPIVTTHPSIENCNNSEEVQISINVRPSPTPDFSYSNTLTGTVLGPVFTGCRLDTVYFAGNSNAGGTGLIVDRFKWNFSTDIADTSRVQNPSKYYLAPGNYNVKLSAITTEGCLGDTVKTITIYPPPTSDFTATPVSACEPAAVTLTSAAAYAGSTAVNSWYWNYGNGQTTINATNAPVSTTYPGYGTYVVKHVAKISALCISDTVSKTVTVYAKPKPNFTYPLGCLGADGIAQFNNASTVPDGQALTYNWNFGDAANSTPANPNTSTQQSPSHKYISFGTYQVQLSVTTANGCTKDTTISITFSLRPTLAFTPITGVCLNGTPVSIANASVTNGVPGSGIYKGPGTDTAGNFNPATAGVGTHTIWYVYAGAGGCRDSISQTVIVSPVPVAAYTYPQGCLDPSGTAQFNSTSTIPGGQTLSYLWNFGDSAHATVSNPNTSTLQNPTHQYTTFGTYNVRLTVSSANGCSKDTMIPIVFSLRPTLVYAAIPSVCINRTSFSIANASVTNGVPGNGVYRGPGTDMLGNFNPATAGTGTHTIWYIYRAGTGGCSDSVSQTVKVFPKPTAAFSLSKAVFCADSSTVINVQSAVASGTIKDWHWDFGDNTTGVYQNNNSFVKTYVAGNYTIKHYVISDSSCVSDTISKTVSVNPIPVADFTLPASVCMPAGKAPFINTSAVAGGGTLTYNWKFGDGSLSTDKDPLHIYAASGPYNISLEAVTAAGCRDTATKTLSTFYDQPVARFSFTPVILCQGATNTFTDLSTAPNSTITKWEWNFGDGTKSPTASPKKKYISPGNYTISLNVQSLQGCISDTFRQTAYVYLQPLVNAGPSFIVPEGTPVRFAAITNDTTLRFRWTPGGQLSNDTILNPTLTVLTNQVYYLTATGDGNCTASDSLTVKVLRPVTIPNAFSPNGDGINDTWVIPNLADYPGATIEIYDRYGKMIVRNTGYAKPWDGTYQQKPLPIATYYYIIDLKNGFKTLTGSVTIIR